MVTVGSLLYGFCNGYFGHDSYGDKTVVAMGHWDGVPWIVASEHGACLVFASGFAPALLDEWAKP